MNLRPLYDQILITKIVDSTITEGGIQLIKAAELNQGKVVAVGHGRLNDITGELDDLVVEPGMIVAYGKHAGQEISLGEADYLMIREADVLGILEK